MFRQGVRAGRRRVGLSVRVHDVPASRRQPSALDHPAAALVGILFSRRSRPIRSRHPRLPDARLPFRPPTVHVALARMTAPRLRVSTARPAFLLVTGRTFGFVVSFVIPLVLARAFNRETFGTYRELFLLYTTLYT